MRLSDWNQSAIDLTGFIGCENDQEVNDGFGTDPCRRISFGHARPIGRVSIVIGKIPLTVTPVPLHSRASTRTNDTRAAFDTI
jgi:hypothetical protein